MKLHIWNHVVNKKVLNKSKYILEFRFNDSLPWWQLFTLLAFYWLLANVDSEANTNYPRASQLKSSISHSWATITYRDPFYCRCGAPSGLHDWNTNVICPRELFNWPLHRDVTWTPICRKLIVICLEHIGCYLNRSIEQSSWATITILTIGLVPSTTRNPTDLPMETHEVAKNRPPSSARMLPMARLAVWIDMTPTNLTTHWTLMITRLSMPLLN